MNNYKSVSEFGGKRYKHVFFDMDNTLTPSRSMMTEEMSNFLQELMIEKDVVIVSGSQESQVWKQIPEFFRGKISLLVQNGNNAYSSKEGEYLWERKLTDDEKKDIFSHISKVEERYVDLIAKVRKEENLIEDRGCQISFSFVGHNAPLEDKMRFDPKGDLRAKIMLEVPLLSRQVGIKIGGTTCFDYNQIGKNKGYNVLEWMKHFSWQQVDALYVGDALFPGGNDDTMFGVCDTLQVSGHKETLAAIEKML